MISVVFYARFLIHHLTDFCDRMYELTDHNFYFVETEKMPTDRKNMGYKEEGLDKPYCINIRESNEQLQLALRLARECDVAIIGCGSYRFMDERFRHTSKLTFKLKERLYKKGVATRYNSDVKADMYEKHQKYIDCNVYYLSAGVFTATDVHFLGYTQKRIIKWGYFPPFREHTEEEIIAVKEKDFIDVIWVGRFMQTKYPQSPIKAMRYVADKFPNVRLSFIGGGELDEEMHGLVEKYKLQKNVFFEGFLPSDQVRDRMLKADICLCTSGYEEGWGATIGEAMNEGCMVIASTAAGGTGYLITPGFNGKIFPYTNVKALADCICEAAENSDQIIDYGLKGYHIVKNTWNGFVAADRLFDISKQMLLKGDWELYESGPCSYAPIIHTMKELGKWRHAYSPKTHVNVAIDGLSGCGKSSLAKYLSKKHGLLYIDSGALYRFVTYILNGREEISENDLNFLKDVQMSPKGDIIWHGRTYIDEIALPEVKKMVSLVAQKQIVRDSINQWIRAKAEGCSVVMDGRDIGSVVLPEAELKLFIHCSIEHRILNWRKGQMERYGTIDPALELEEKNNLETRDYNDLHREIAPLVCPKDALIFDLEKYGLEKICRIVSDLVSRRLV